MGRVAEAVEAGRTGRSLTTAKSKPKQPGHLALSPQNHVLDSLCGNKGLLPASRERLSVLWEDAEGGAVLPRPLGIMGLLRTGIMPSGEYGLAA